MLEKLKTICGEGNYQMFTCAKCHMADSNYKNCHFLQKFTSQLILVFLNVGYWRSLQLGRDMSETARNNEKTEVT